MMKRLSGACLALALMAAQSQAAVIHTFSEHSSDTTDPSVLNAQVTYTVQGSQLVIEIVNQSDYRIAQLYFNADETLTGLAFNPAGSTNNNWSISGSGTSQTQEADGMGSYNWLVDFGSGGHRLPKGPSATLLVLDMTGTTTEQTILTKLSTNPPGNISAVSVIKFEAGPGGDSAFGSGVPDINDHDKDPPNGDPPNGDPPNGDPPNGDPPIIPEPSSLALLGTGALGLLARRRRKKLA